jgi:uncharacterized protein
MIEKKESWSLLYVSDLLLGDFFASYVFRNPNPIELSQKTVAAFNDRGLNNLHSLVPSQIFSCSMLFALKGFIRRVGV